MDEWSEWLLHKRHAGDAAYAQVVRESVAVYADRVLDGARLGPGMTLADIGCGEGLVALRAIERAGGDLRVILTDVSAPMLQHARAQAEARGLAAHCMFLECPADRLGAIDAASVDAVVTRAVLAYVPDKATALGEFLRILRPGGRISLSEPILQDEAFYVRALRARLDQPQPGRDDRFLRLLYRWKSAQFPDSPEAFAQSPIVNFSERDLVNLVKAAGFTDIHLQFLIDVVPSPVTSWPVFLGNSPHPWAPSLQEIMACDWSDEDRRFFESIVRPLVESGRNIHTDRVAYLQATRPAQPSPSPGA